MLHRTPIQSPTNACSQQTLPSSDHTHRVRHFSTISSRFARRICLRKEVLPPCQQIAARDPGLLHPVVRRGLSCANLGVTVKDEIDLREILHLFRVTRGTNGIFLEQRLSALPGGLYLRQQLGLLAPFLFKTTGRVIRLNRACKKASRWCGESASSSSSRPAPFGRAAISLQMCCIARAQA